MSCLTTFSEMTMASSKLYPFQGMNATRTFLPSASSPRSVEAPSASRSPFFTFMPTATRGFWVTLVSWLVRRNLISEYVRTGSSNAASASSGVSS